MLAFIHIPKTAGSSMTQLLRSNFGIRHCEIPERDRNIGTYTVAELESDLAAWPCRLNSISSHSLSLVSNLHEYQEKLCYFSFLRDPIKRSISHYQYHLNRTSESISLESWIQNNKMQNLQTSYFSKEKNSEQAIENILKNSVFIGITEDFQKSIAILNQSTNANIQYRNEPRRNVSAKSSSKDSILKDPTRLALIIAHNEEDQKLYNYFQQRLSEYPTSHVQDPDTSASFVKSFNLHSNRLVRNLYFKPRLRLIRQSS